MAGDWIPMRINLTDDPDVLAIATALELDEFAVVGRLHRLWSWANEHTADGIVQRVKPAWVDRLTACPGFAEAMAAAGWLVISSDGITFPKFDNWNSKGAKARLEETVRKRQKRGVSDACPEFVPEETGQTPDKTRTDAGQDPDKTRTTEEKRIEEEIQGVGAAGEAKNRLGDENDPKERKPQKQTPAERLADLYLFTATVRSGIHPTIPELAASFADLIAHGDDPAWLEDHVRKRHKTDTWNMFVVSLKKAREASQAARPTTNGKPSRKTVEEGIAEARARQRAREAGLTQ